MMLTGIAKHGLAVVAAAAICAAGTTAFAAQQEKSVSFGVQGDWSSDADFGVGGRAIINLDKTRKGLEGVVSFDYFFPSTGASVPGASVDLKYFEINANVVYKFTLEKQSFHPYVGAGLNIGHASGGFGIDLGTLGTFDASASSTDLGLNILGGVLFNKKFFVEAKLEAGGGGTNVVSAGIRF